MSVSTTQSLSRLHNTVFFAVAVHLLWLPAHAWLWWELLDNHGFPNLPGLLDRLGPGMLLADLLCLLLPLLTLAAALHLGRQVRRLKQHLRNRTAPDPINAPLVDLLRIQQRWAAAGIVIVLSFGAFPFLMFATLGL